MHNTENVLRILTFVRGGSILKMLGGQKGRLFLFLGNKKKRPWRKHLIQMK